MKPEYVVTPEELDRGTRVPMGVVWDEVQIEMNQWLQVIDKNLADPEIDPAIFNAVQMFITQALPMVVARIEKALCGKVVSELKDGQLTRPERVYDPLSFHDEVRRRLNQ